MDDRVAHLRSLGHLWHHLRSGYPFAHSQEFWDRLSIDLILAATQDADGLAARVTSLLQTVQGVVVHDRESDHGPNTDLDNNPKDPKYVKVSWLATPQLREELRPNDDGVYRLDLRGVDEANVESVLAAWSTLSKFVPGRLRWDVRSRWGRVEDSVMGGVGLRIVTHEAFATDYSNLPTAPTGSDCRDSKLDIIVDRLAPLPIRCLVSLLEEGRAGVRVHWDRYPDPPGLDLHPECSYQSIVCDALGLSVRMPVEWSDRFEREVCLLRLDDAGIPAPDASPGVVERVRLVWRMFSDLRQFALSGSDTQAAQLDSGLASAIAVALEVEDSYSALFALCSAMDDPHCVVPMWQYTQQVLLEPIEGGYEVSQVPSSGSSLCLGDRIVAVDGDPVLARAASVERRTGGRASARRVQVEHHLLDSSAEQASVVVDRGGKRLVIDEPLRTPGYGITPPALPLTPLVAELEAGIRYVNLTRAEWADVEWLADFAEGAVGGVLLDVRGYVAEGLGFDFFAQLGETLLPFALWQARIDMNRGDARMQSVVGGLQMRRNLGRWRVLVDHRTLSSGEYVAWMSRSLAAARLVGSATSGGLGRVARLTDRRSGLDWLFTYRFFRGPEMALSDEGGLRPDLLVAHARHDGVIDVVSKHRLYSDSVVRAAINDLRLSHVNPES